MPRLVLILGVLTGLATLAGCATGEPVSTARLSPGATPTTSTTTSQPPALAAPPAQAANPAPANPAAAGGAKPAPARPATATPTPTTVAPPATADLTAITDSKLGKLVTDQNGMTVYFLTSDPTKPPASTCVDDCAKLWPPVLLPSSGTVSVTGIDAKLVGKLTRADRNVQLTLAGHPLYRFSADTPGTTLGNGLANAAFAITPTGTKPPRPEV